MGIARVNQTLFQYLFGFSRQSSFLDAVIVFAATYLPYAILAAFFLFALSRKEWRLKLFLAIEGVLAIILARGLIAGCIKFFYLHPRPFAPLDLMALIDASGNSFPSGHATLLFALSTTAILAHRTLGAWCFSLALLNGLARVVAGVHWPLDIVGGAAVGILSAVLIHKLLEPTARALEAGNKPPEAEAEAPALAQ